MRPKPRAVRRYLAEFLSDPRVIEIPATGVAADPARHHPAHPADASRPTPIARSGPTKARRWRPSRSGRRRRCASGSAGRDRRLRDALRQSRDRRGGRADDRATAARASSPRRSIRNIARRRPPAPTMRCSPRWRRCAGSRRCGPCRLIMTTRSISTRLQANLERQLAALDFEPERLLLSFHGMPRADARAGRSLSLPLPEDRAPAWPKRSAATVDVAFQSRFGRAKWLEPATDAIAGGLSGEGREEHRDRRAGLLRRLPRDAGGARHSRPRHVSARRRHAFRAARLPQRRAEGMAMLDALIRRELAGWLAHGLSASDNRNRRESWHEWRS